MKGRWFLRFPRHHLSNSALSGSRQNVRNAELGITDSTGVLPRWVKMAWSLCGRVDAQTAMQEGLPWEEIVNKSWEVDLLVLGRSPARANGRLFSQQIVQRVIENSA